MKRRHRTLNKIFNVISATAGQGFFFQNLFFGRKNDILSMSSCRSNKKIYTYKKVIRYCYKIIKELKKFGDEK